MSRQLRPLAGRLTLSASLAGPSSRSPASMLARWLSNSVHQVVSRRVIDDERAWDASVFMAADLT